MSTRQKWIIAAANLLAAAAAILMGRLWSDGLSSESARRVATDHNWLVLLCLLFGGSFWVAWRYNGSISISTTRMLLWAVIAYLCISNAIDLLGGHYGIIQEILGLAQPTSPGELLLELRARLAVFAVMIAMAITAIAVGFEPREES